MTGEEVFEETVELPDGRVHDIRNPFRIGELRKPGYIAEDHIGNFVSLPVLSPEVRQSGISTFFTCHRKFLFAERLRIEKTGGYKSAAELGKMFHLGLTALWKGHTEAVVRRAISQYALDLEQRIVAKAEANGGHAEGLSKTIEQLHFDAAMALAMVLVHFNKHPLPDWATPIAVEKELRVRVSNLNVVLGCRLDVAIAGKHPKLGPIILITDHKTTTDTARYTEKAAFAVQQQLYRVCATPWVQREYPDHKLVGFVYNTMRKPTCRMKVRQTPEEFLTECIDWYNAKADANSKEVYKTGEQKGEPKPRWDWTDNKEKFDVEPPFEHTLVKWEGPVLTAEFAQILQQAKAATKTQPTLSVFARTGEPAGWCVNTYGSECPYLPLCKTHPKSWSKLLAASYGLRADEYNPTDVEELTYTETK